MTHRLKEVWARINNQISDGPVAAMDGAAADAQPPIDRLCFTAGRCLCDRDGRKLVTTHNKVSAVLRKGFSKVSGRRPMLQSCDAVALFHTAGAGGVSIEEGRARPTSMLWLLIADATLKPFVPMWRRMQPGSDSPELKFSDNGEFEAAGACRLFLEDAGESFGPWELAQLLLPTSIWRAVFFQVDVSAAVLARVTPCGLYVKPLEDGSGQVVWAARNAAHHKKLAAMDEWAEFAEESDDSAMADAADGPAAADSSHNDSECASSRSGGGGTTPWGFGPGRLFARRLRIRWRMLASGRVGR